MRNLKYIFIVIVAMFSAVSCNNDTEGYTEIAIYYKSKSMTILDDVTETTAIFTAQSSWSISIDTAYQSWLSTSVVSGAAGHYEIKLLTTPNTSFESRTGYVTIVGETQQNTLTLTQKGLEIIEFNDPVFEEYCLKNYGNDTTDYLTTAEAHKATDMQCPSMGITDFTGLEFFTNITNADLSGNQMVTLSVSTNVALKTLNISDCSNLEGFEIGTELTSLTKLDCHNCKIPSITMDSCILLETFDCSNNQLSTLNLTENIALSNLDCTGNPNLTTIFINEDQEIESLKKDEYTQLVYPDQTVDIPDAVFKSYLIENFDSNRDQKISVEEALGATDIRIFGHDGAPKNVKSLKGIEYFPNITYLECSYCQIESLDLTCNPKLTIISCHHNPLTSIKISTYSPLEQLDCSYCPNLDYLSLNKNPHLTNLYANCCSIEEVDFDYCYALYSIAIDSNKITKIDFTTNEDLVYLSCAHNEIESLRVKNCDSLAYLFCNNNKLSSFDIDPDYIYDIDFSSNKFEGELDFSEYEELHSIRCDSNEITGITLPKSELLMLVSAQANKLSKLDVSSLPEIREVYAADNLLTEINTSSSDKLERMFFNKNSLAGTVDFSINRNMKQLWLQDNPDLETIWGPKGVESIEIKCDPTAKLLYK